MDLRHARTFVTVAELGTVTKAAARLHIAQPALSRQIADLERELGLRLFDRLGRRLVLTGEGAQLLSECRHLLGAAASVRERAETLRGGRTGILRLAASPQFIEGVLADFLHLYRERYPGVRVQVVESMVGTDTLEMVERGDIHLGQNLLRAVAADDARFGSKALGAIELLAASRDPLDGAQGDAIDIARLASMPLLLLEPGLASRRALDATFRLAGAEPNVVFESRTPHPLLAMAERGHGVAIVPSAVQIDRYALRVSAVTYRGKPIRERLAVFWDTRRSLPGYTTEFCTMLAEHVDAVFPISRPGATARSSRPRATAPTRKIPGRRREVPSRGGADA